MTWTDADQARELDQLVSQHLRTLTALADLLRVDADERDIVAVVRAAREIGIEGRRLDADALALRLVSGS